MKRLQTLHESIYEIMYDLRILVPDDVHIVLHETARALKTFTILARYRQAQATLPNKAPEQENAEPLPKISEDLKAQLNDLERCYLMEVGIVKKYLDGVE